MMDMRKAPELPNKEAYPDDLPVAEVAQEETKREAVELLFDNDYVSVPREEYDVLVRADAQRDAIVLLLKELPAKEARDAIRVILGLSAWEVKG